MMNTMRLIAASLACAALSTQAQTAPTAPPQPPLSQGLSSVEKNLARDPDNQGLQNAQQRLQANQLRQETHRVTVDQRIDAARLNRVERPTRPNR